MLVRWPEEIPLTEPGLVSPKDFFLQIEFWFLASVSSILLSWGHIPEYY